MHASEHESREPAEKVETAIQRLQKGPSNRDLGPSRPRSRRWVQLLGDRVPVVGKVREQNPIYAPTQRRIELVVPAAT